MLLCRSIFNRIVSDGLPVLSAVAGGMSALHTSVSLASAAYCGAASTTGLVVGLSVSGMVAAVGIPFAAAVGYFGVKEVLRRVAPDGIFPVVSSPRPRH